MIADLEFFGPLSSSRSSQGFRGHNPFEFDLGAEPVEITLYDGERQFLAGAPIGNGAIAGRSGSNAGARSASPVRKLNSSTTLK